MSEDGSWVDYESDADSEPEQTRKRKFIDLFDRNNSHFHPSAKKPRIVCFDQSSIWHLLSILDPEGKLAVYEFSQDYHDDILVKTFVDGVIKYKLLPILPSPGIMASWCEHEINIDISEDLNQQLVTNFKRYLESKYFYHNSTKQTTTGMGLFDQLQDLGVIKFHEFPLVVREGIMNLTKEYMDNFYEETCISAEFLQQNFVLKNIAATMDHIQNVVRVEDDEDQLLYLEKTLGMAYELAKTEFPKLSNVKAIDWSENISKAIGSNQVESLGETEVVMKENEPKPEQEVSRKIIKATRRLGGNKTIQNADSSEPDNSTESIQTEESCPASVEGTTSSASMEDTVAQA